MTNSETTNAAGNSVFDKVAGKAKEVVGAVIGDDDLAQEGELQQEKARAAKAAAELTAEAEQRDAEAALKAEVTQNRLEQQQVAADLAERTREQQLERERAAAQSGVEREALDREAAVRREAEAAQRILDAKESAVVVDLVDDASVATEIEQEAERAERAAEALSSAQRNLEQK
ncbi:MAG TPA: hypothetical protein VNB24_05240 [Acidimicrobiales bacterium]|nr:hypothetical protein [Acidimicrobiales bacterium]